MTSETAREGDVRWRAIPSLVRDWEAFRDGKSALQIGIPEWLHLQVDETLTALTALQAELDKLATYFREEAPTDGFEGDVEGLSPVDMAIRVMRRGAELSALKADNERLRDKLNGIHQYGSDTLSGSAEGITDIEWFREGIRGMMRRAALGKDK